MIFEFDFTVVCMPWHVVNNTREAKRICPIIEEENYSLFPIQFM